MAARRQESGEMVRRRGGVSGTLRRGWTVRESCFFFDSSESPNREIRGWKWGVFSRKSDLKFTKRGFVVPTRGLGFSPTLFLSCGSASRMPEFVEFSGETEVLFSFVSVLSFFESICCFCLPCVAYFAPFAGPLSYARATCLQAVARLLRCAGVRRRCPPEQAKARNKRPGPSWLCE